MQIDDTHVVVAGECYPFVMFLGQGLVILNDRFSVLLFLPILLAPKVMAVRCMGVIPVRRRFVIHPLSFELEFAEIVGALAVSQALIILPDILVAIGIRVGPLAMLFVPLPFPIVRVAVGPRVGFIRCVCEGCSAKTCQQDQQGCKKEMLQSLVLLHVIIYYVFLH